MVLAGSSSGSPRYFLSVAPDKPGFLIITFFADRPPSGGTVFDSLLEKTGGFVDEVQKYTADAANSIANLYTLAEKAAKVVKAGVPQLIEALRTNPKQLVSNLLGGIENGFQQFFSANNFNTIVGKVENWLFGNVDDETKKALGDLLKKIPTINFSDPKALSDFAIEALTKLGKIDKIDWNYLKGVLSDVTGLDVDSLVARSQVLQDLANAPDFLQAALTKLDGFATGIKDQLTSVAQDQLVNLLFQNALKVLPTKLLPQGALLSTLYGGLSFLLDTRNQQIIDGLITKLQQGLSTLINGKPEDVGKAVAKTLNDAVPLVLSLIQKQLLPDFKPQETLKAILTNVDVRTWIYKGAQNLWNSIQKNFSQALLDKLPGAPLTAPLTVGDPWIIRGLQKKKR